MEGAGRERAHFLRSRAKEARRECKPSVRGHRWPMAQPKERSLTGRQVVKNLKADESNPEKRALDRTLSESVKAWMDWNGHGLQPRQRR
jgi:hypothetical protein